MRKSPAKFVNKYTDNRIFLNCPTNAKVPKKAQTMAAEISSSNGYEVYRLASNMPKYKKSCKQLPA